jgi:hypothetical protein
MNMQNIKISFNVLSLVVLVLLLMTLSLVTFLSISSPQTLHAQVGPDAGSGPDPGSQNADGSGAGGCGNFGAAGGFGGTANDPNGPPDGSSGGPGGACVNISSCTYGRNGNCDSSTIICTQPSSLAPVQPVITFTASNYNPVYSGSTVLSWSTTGSPTSCTASGDWSGSKNVLGGTEAMNSIVTTRTYVLSCSNNDGTDVETVTVTPQPPLPPIINLTAIPDHINPNESSVLNWSVSRANSCSASGEWSGVKSPVSGTDRVSPSVTSNYTLNCLGEGGISNTRTVQIKVPTGSLTASTCIIPIEGGSCNSTVTWTSNDFFNTPSISQGSTPSFSTAPYGSEFKSVSVGNSEFTLKDSGGTFILTDDALPRCATGSVWVAGLTPPRCAKLPVIGIYADPKLIRSGKFTDVKIEVESDYDLACTLAGGANQTFSHAKSLSARSYSYNTNPLNAASVVQITCVHNPYPLITATEEARINVVGVPEEI